MFDPIDRVHFDTDAWLMKAEQIAPSRRRRAYSIDCGEPFPLDEAVSPKTAPIEPECFEQHIRAGEVYMQSRQLGNLDLFEEGQRMRTLCYYIPLIFRNHFAGSRIPQYTNFDREMMTDVLWFTWQCEVKTSLPENLSVWIDSTRFSWAHQIRNEICKLEEDADLMGVWPLEAPERFTFLYNLLTVRILDGCRKILNLPRKEEEIYRVTAKPFTGPELYLCVPLLYASEGDGWVFWTAKDALQAGINSAAQNRFNMKDKLFVRSETNINHFTVSAQNLPADTDCPICHMDICKPVKTVCGHVFCAECLSDWSNADLCRREITCPMCRLEFIIPRVDVYHYRTNRSSPGSDAALDWNDDVRFWLNVSNLSDYTFGLLCRHEALMLC